MTSADVPFSLVFPSVAFWTSASQLLRCRDRLAYPKHPAQPSGNSQRLILLLGFQVSTQLDSIRELLLGHTDTAAETGAKICVEELTTSIGKIGAPFSDEDQDATDIPPIIDLQIVHPSGVAACFPV